MDKQAGREEPSAVGPTRVPRQELPLDERGDVLIAPLPDEASMRARRRRGFIGGVILACSTAFVFCCFISVLIGVPQSFIGQWWMSPPRFPGAVEVRFVEGEVCLMNQPNVYCYEWFYRTDASVEEVIGYYEGLDWALHDAIKFEWRRGRRFGLNWVAEDCVYVVSNIACYQIIARPSPDEQGNTEIYILERGAMGSVGAD